MISFVLIIPTLVLASLARVETLSALSTQRKTYEPRTEVRALFSNEMNQNAKVPAEANLMLDTKLPTINLINFEPIHTVQCTGDVLTIDFDNLQGAETALAAWAPFAGEGNLAMIAAPQHGCGGTKMAFMDVTNLRLEGKVMKATQYALEPKEVILEYRLEVAQAVPKSRLEKRGEPEATIPLNLNFDGNSAEVQNKTIFQSSNDNATCVNCYMKGHSTFKIFMGGDIDDIHTLRFRLEGELTANLDLHLRSKTSITRDLDFIEIFKIHLNPIDIGGVIEIGPSLGFGITFGLKAGISHAAEFNIGSLFHYPFKLDMGIDGLNNGTRPLFNYTGVPKVTPAPLRFTGGDAAVVASIGSRLAFKFKMFNIGVMFSLTFATELGVDVKSHLCENVPVDVSLFSKTALTTAIHYFGYKIGTEIWGTERIPILCAFCNKCPNHHWQRR